MLNRLLFRIVLAIELTSACDAARWLRCLRASKTCAAGRTRWAEAAVCRLHWRRDVA